MDEPKYLFYIQGNWSIPILDRVNASQHQITFQDISKLYNIKNGGTTTCCGRKINKAHINPSHFLCVFSISLFYLEYKNIEAYIINNDTM